MSHTYRLLSGAFLASVAKMYLSKLKFCLLFFFFIFVLTLLKKNKFAYTQEDVEKEEEAIVRNEEGEEDDEVADGSGSDIDANYGLQLNEVDCGEDPPFPNSAFAAQPNKNLVYLRVDKLALTSLHECGLYKFASAFGVRVVADYDVPDERLLYVTSTLAEFLDIREEAKVKNAKLLETLHAGHAMIVLFSDENLMRPLLEIENRPGELKCFPRAFHMSMITQILPHEKQEEVCPQDYGTKDRTMGLVGDFIVSKGYPFAFFGPVAADVSGSEESRSNSVQVSPTSSRMKMHFRTAIRSKWINTGASECNTSTCLEIAFQSWALSSALDADKCWCEEAREFNFCTQEKLKFGFPALWETLSKMFELNNKKYRPDGIYHSKALVSDVN